MTDKRVKFHPPPGLIAFFLIFLMATAGISGILGMIEPGFIIVHQALIILTYFVAGETELVEKDDGIPLSAEDLDND